MGMLLIAHSVGRAQSTGDPAAEAHVRQGIDFVYDLSFDSARAHFKAVTKLQPDHPAGYFFLAMVEWWNIIIEIDNTSRDDKFLSMLDRVIDVCDKRLDDDENDVTAMFFKGGALGFKGRLHGNRGDWLKAANAGREAMPIVQDAYKLAPGNNDILLGIGIYNYYAEVVPDQYPVVKPLMVFFPKGDKKKGIEQLQRASDKAAYANIEATYFLIQVLQNYEARSAEALALAQRLHKRFPNNVVFHKYIGRCLSSLGRSNEMGAVFSEVLTGVEHHKRGYDVNTEREARYYLGMAEFDGRNDETSLQHFYRCDELSRTLDKESPSGFMVMANLRVGMIYDAQSKRELARAQYNKVLDMNDYRGAHDIAKGYMKTPFARP